MGFTYKLVIIKERSSSLLLEANADQTDQLQAERNRFF